MRPVPPEYVTRAELAEIFRVSSKTVKRMVDEGMPEYRWMRRTIRYDRVECERWARERGRIAA